MAEKEWDVVVIGAGPVGLALALGLARQSRDVLVLEKEEGLSERSRAPLIWPRTQEILSDLGVIDSFVEESLLRRNIQLWDADRERPLLRFPIEELRGETAFPQVLLCPQSKTERLLYDALKREPSAEVRFSTEATAVRRRTGAVEVRCGDGAAARSVAGAFVAGCDGAHSHVRDAVADAFEGRTYSVEAALADLTFARELEARSPRITRRRGVATALRISQRRWRVIMPRSPEEKRPLPSRLERAASDLFPSTSYEVRWKSEFNLHRRISRPLVRGRVALAGDAAHLTSPVGGQGMNLGIQDAAALREALLRAPRQDSLEPLAQYDATRRTALETGAVWATDQLTRLLLARRGTFLVPFLRAFGLLLRAGPVRQVVMRRMAMLDDPSRE